MLMHQIAVIFSDMYYRKCRNEKNSRQNKKPLETKESMEAQEAFD